MACSMSRPALPTPVSIPSPSPKNVILLIGDGMGLPQITGAMYMNHNKIVFEEFTNIGFHKSAAADNLITDSAAGATAFASGVKTNNGAIGMNAKKQSVPTLLEIAEGKGMATGMVVSCSITHATPAAFIAHVENRQQVEDIALDYLKTPIDLVIGGGMDHFTRRDDERDLAGEWRANGYAVADFFSLNVEDLDTHTDKNIVYFTANGEPLPAREGRDYLLPATNKALAFLDNRSPEGFFLMIEGAQIDWGGHANDANYVVTELLEFDKIIRTALKFARNNKETLVIVTGDHETGGFAVQPGSSLDDIDVAFTTKHHTATMIPVFADGPGAELFRGVYENTDIFQKIKALLQLP